MNWHRLSSLQLIINDLNDIAADAYRHRIRPRSKKGGNGVYDTSNGGFSYLLPHKYSFNNRAHFEVLKGTSDCLLLRATSIDDPSCFVTAAVDLRGRLVNICTPGESERHVPESPSRPDAALKPSVQTLQFQRLFKDL